MDHVDSPHITDRLITTHNSNLLAGFRINNGNAFAANFARL
jgi:hypothetical protein